LALVIGSLLNSTETMNDLQEIKSAIGRLSADEMRQIYVWLETILEDQMEISEAFRQRIERSEREMAEGKQPRVRWPKSA
jgi:hypothetical protein